MNLRTKHRSKELLKEKINGLSALQADGFRKLVEGLIVPERVHPVKRMLFSQQLHIAIAKYSIGDSLDEFRPDFIKALELLPEVWDDDSPDPIPDYLHDWCCKMIWLLVLGDALRITDDQFMGIVAVWDRTGRKDWLIDYLIRARVQERALHATLLFPKPYATLKEAEECGDPAKAAALLKRYLEKEWYKGHKNVYWYENHTSKHNVFFGYWAFEAVAVVKQAGIDDSSFRDNEYYPKDLFV